MEHVQSITTADQLATAGTAPTLAAVRAAVGGGSYEALQTEVANGVRLTLELTNAQAQASTAQQQAQQEHHADEIRLMGERLTTAQTEQAASATREDAGETGSVAGTEFGVAGCFESPNSKIVLSYLPILASIPAYLRNRT